MKRAFVFALVLAAMTGGSIAYSATQGGGMPGGTAVWGGGHAATSVGDRDFSVVADKAGGTFLYGVYGLAHPVIAGDVMCVNVSGNQAVVGGTVTDANFAPQTIGTPFVWYVRDNGGPFGAARDQVTAVYAGFFSKADLIAAGLPAAFPHVCPSALNVISDARFTDMTAGDIVVQGAGS